MAWAQDFSPGVIRTTGVLEVLGATGLILPAVGLAANMVGAAAVHARRRELQMLPANAVLLALAAFVAWGRFGPYSL